MNSLKHLGLPVMAVGAMSGEEELRRRDGDGLRKIFLSDGRIVGFRLVGDIRAAGVRHRQQRDELGQREQAEGERRAGQGVDRVGQGDVARLAAEEGGALGEPESAERRGRAQ